jgi:uncharacterized metal-binding protein
MKRGVPLVYSCSGCSSAAQMANQMAIRLDRAGLAEMSCIAGVGGGVPGLLKTAQSGRPILAIDGCPMACVKACLALAGVQASDHILLSDFKVRKQKHADFDPVQSDHIFQNSIQPSALALAVPQDECQDS